MRCSSTVFVLDAAPLMWLRVCQSIFALSESPKPIGIMLSVRCWARLFAVKVLGVYVAVGPPAVNCLCCFLSVGRASREKTYESVGNFHHMGPILFKHLVVLLAEGYQFL